MKHLFEDWHRVEDLVGRARHVLLVSDFDGTLTPIVQRPNKAALSQKARRLLESLSRRANLTMGVLSGRSLGDLKERVGVNGLVYGGNHGIEIEGPDFCFLHHGAGITAGLLSRLYPLLCDRLEDIEGAWVENKRFSLSVHYREVADGEVNLVRQGVTDVLHLAHATRQVWLSNGKKVFEIRPAISWNKGSAVRWLLGRVTRLNGRDVLPVFIGDDVTDEDGFEAVSQDESGISVFVGKDNGSAARYHLRSTDEVHEFLSGLCQRLQTATKPS